MSSGDQSRIDEFFEDKTDSEKKRQNKVSSHPKKADLNTSQNSKETSSGRQVGKKAESGEQKILQNLPNSKILPPPDGKEIYLLDIQYSGNKNKAVLTFVDPISGQLFQWIDQTGHRPYLLTTLKPDEIMQVDRVASSKNFVGIESVTRTNLLLFQERKYSRIIGSNPLAIGGRQDSFRQLIGPAYEADIRYHLNYICDRAITPASFFEFRDNKPHERTMQIDEEIQNALEKAFENEEKEEKDLLQEYMPLLFSPMPDVLRASFDIEVASDEGRMPNVVEAEQAIISIALTDTLGNRVVWVLLRKKKSGLLLKQDVIIRVFHNEKELIRDFFSIISRYPIVVTFNGDNFDIPYLIRRAMRLEFSEQEIPFEIKNKEGYCKSGAVHLDLYQFFKQAAIKVYAFGNAYDSASLDELSSALLGKQKIEFEGTIENLTLDKLLEYNLRDAELTLELTRFNNNLVMDLIWTLMRITKMPMHDFIRNTVSTWIRNWFIFEHRKKKLLIPNRSDILSLKGSASTTAMIKGKKYQGAIVITPKAGIWWNVHVMDFASLYPSLIKVRNLSYETINCPHQDCQENVVPGTTHWVCTKKQGFMSALVGFIRDVRVNWFKPKTKDSSLPKRVRNQYNVIQASLKVLINAAYGVFGAEYFSFYCPPVAESTAALARFAISKTKEYCENVLGLEVIYGDTDSVFLLNPSDEAVEELKKWSRKELQVDLGTDYVFRYVVLSERKKNYFGVTNDGKIIVKGLLGKKRNTPPMVRKAFQRVLNTLRNIHSEKDFETARAKIISEIRILIKKIKSFDFDIEEIAISQTVSQSLKNYKAWTPVLQAIAQLFSDEDTTRQLGEGSTIFFVPVRPFRFNVNTEAIPKQYQGTQTCSVKPIERVKKRDEIDTEKIIEHVRSTFSQILETLEISWDEIQGVQSIDQFFD